MDDLICKPAYAGTHGIIAKWMTAAAVTHLIFAKWMTAAAVTHLMIARSMIPAGIMHLTVFDAVFEAVLPGDPDAFMTPARANAFWKLPDTEFHRKAQIDSDLIP